MSNERGIGSFRDIELRPVAFQGLMNIWVWGADWKKEEFSFFIPPYLTGLREVLKEKLEKGLVEMRRSWHQDEEIEIIEIAKHGSDEYNTILKGLSLSGKSLKFLFEKGYKPDFLEKHEKALP